MLTLNDENSFFQPICFYFQQNAFQKCAISDQLLLAAIQLCSESIEGMHIEYVDIKPLPFLNTDLESGGSFPEPVEAFRRKVLDADSILFASPEYNYSVTGEC